MSKPVKLIAKTHKIRNDFGILYTTHTAIPCNDLDAPECAFERAQVAAGVLLVIPEVDEAAAIAEAEAAAKAEAERLAAEAFALSEEERLAAEAEAFSKAEEERLAAEAEAAAAKPAKKA